MNTTLLGLALVVAAPNLKDEPKKVPEIVGQWVVEKMSVGGKEAGRTPTDMVYEFTADGQWLIKRDGVLNKTPPREIKYDTKAKPATIDVIYTTAAPGKGGISRDMHGIYKVEGDTLTICLSPSGGERPTKFDSDQGTPVMLMTLTRVKKKD
jgi:uncharacterized protein (TIGR03067 family)